MKSNLVISLIMSIGFPFCMTNSIVYCQSPNSTNKLAKEITLADARKAFNNVKPEKAIKYLEDIMNNPNYSIKDKVKAGGYWSSLQSKIYNNFDKASIKMKEIIALEDSNSNLYIDYAEIAASFKKYDLAIENSNNAISFAKTKKNKIRAYSSKGKIIYQSIFYNLSNTLSNNKFTGFNIDTLVVSNTIKQLKRVIHEDPTQRELLKTIFGLEILSGKGAEAMLTWKEYFNYTNKSNSLILNTCNELNAPLINWGKDDFSLNSRKELAYALANARRFDLSLLFIKTLPKSTIMMDDRLTELVNYGNFLTEIKQITTEFYRNSTIKEPEPSLYRNQMVERVKQLWNTFKWSGQPKQFSLNNFETEIDLRFGASIRIGNSNGWFSITWGHKVIEYLTEINQYGQKSQMVFRSLDYLVSNGFLGWYYDTIGVIGGWQSDEIVYQVRPRYLAQPIKAWKQVTDNIGIKAFKKSVINQMENDALLAKQEGTVIFQGMLLQIEFLANQELLMDLKQKGYKDNELERKFIEQYEVLTFQNAILSHEGRHLIDHSIYKNINEKLSSQELEYRAKLSEIAFAKYPFMALSSIFYGGISSTPHGQSNKRLAENLYNWMEKNWREVNNIEESKPKGPQLFRLTNLQLVKVVRSLDPLNQK